MSVIQTCDLVNKHFAFLFPFSQTLRVYYVVIQLLHVLDMDIKYSPHHLKILFFVSKRRISSFHYIMDGIIIYMSYFFAVGVSLKKKWFFLGDIYLIILQYSIRSN